MDYEEKPLTNFLNGEVYKNIKIQKLVTCPRCGYGTDTPQTRCESFQLTDDNKIHALIVSYRCNHCKKKYITINQYNTEDKSSSFGVSYPNVSCELYENERINSLSPMFINLYNQSLRAEFNGDFDLAGFGFRASLEHLVKDYAVKVLGENEETVIKKSLFECISDYLKTPELVKTADVIRILGNDYAHFEKKHPEIDFEVLKDFVNIFIDLIDVKLKIANPPVARS